MSHKAKYHISLLLLVLLIGETYAQDIANISKKDILKISGGIGLQTTAYTAIGMEANRDPFMWQLNMNLNLNLLGIIQAPFSASLSSQGTKLSTPQPFNNFGISPNYKAVTLHLGYRSLNLSEFSLSGSQFLGVGIEIKPKDAMVKGKALWGRFAKPIYFNPNGTIATTPSFARYGWGTGVTIGKTAKKEISMRMFKAKDDPTSLEYADSIALKPADNLVLGTTVKYEISKQISAEINGDISFYTTDLTAQAGIDRSNSYANNIFLFGYNGTSEFKKAFSVKVKYKPSFAKFSLDYRRVDPGYKTLGISFINNDYEDLKLKTSFSIFDKKTGISLSGGMQRNNLDATKATQMTRLIGAISLNQKINDKWNGALNYSSFNSNTRQTIIITLDSLQFVQTTQSASLSLVRNSSTPNHNTNLNIAFNFQDVIVDQIHTTVFYNANIGLQRQFLRTKLSTGATLVAVHNTSEVGNTSNIGPSATIGTSILKDKVKINLVGTYLSSFIDYNSSGAITNLTFMANYTLLKKHKITFNMSSILKDVEGTSTSEFTGNFNYSFSF